MPVTGVTGLPGHGKSYGTVKHIIKPALDDGRHVVTNIPMTDQAHNLYPEQITQLDIDNFNPSDYRYGSVVVLDEFWRLCASGTRTSNIEQDFKAFFAEHRHHVGSDGKTTEIVIVTQDFSQICSYVKSLVETTYRVRKVKAGKKQYCRTDIYDGIAQGNPPKGSPMNTLTDNYEDDIFILYNSHMYSENGAGTEQDVDDRRSMFKHPMIRYGLPASILFIILGAYFTYSSITSIAEKQRQEQIKEEQIKAAEEEKKKQKILDQQRKKEIQDSKPKFYKYGKTDNSEEVPYRLVGFAEWGGISRDYATLINHQGYSMRVYSSIRTDQQGIRFVIYDGYKVTQHTGRVSWSRTARETVRVTKSDYTEQ